MKKLTLKQAQNQTGKITKKEIQQVFYSEGLQWRYSGHERCYYVNPAI